MARRATSSTKVSTTHKPASADHAEHVTSKGPRRGRKPKRRDMQPDGMSVADAFFPGGEEPVASSASGSNGPAKGRRVRKPRSIELVAETLTTDGDGAEKDDGADIVDAPAATASTLLESADSIASSSAARWDADTGTASFEWPIIEAVAATTGPNQAMAKLLLAARAEGANSRWPF